MKKAFSAWARIFLCSPLLLFLTLELGYAPVFGGQSNLKVQGGEPVTYDCGRNATITARYYSLSDDSLRFVKVDTPEGNYTLPQLVSGSGARYTDEFQLLWWIKGDTAFAQKPDNNGDWQTVYDNCREIK